MTEFTPDDTRPKSDLALAHRYSLDERRFRTALRSYAPLLRWGFDEKELAARGLDKPTSQSKCPPYPEELFFKGPKVRVPAGTFDGLPPMAAKVVSSLSDTNSYGATRATFSARPSTNDLSTSSPTISRTLTEGRDPNADIPPPSSWTPSPDFVDPPAGPATSNVPSMSWNPSPVFVDPPAVPTTTNAPSMDWEPPPAVADPTNAPSFPSPDVVDHSAGPATSNAPSTSWTPSPDVVDPPAVPTTTNAPSMDWEPSPAVADPTNAPSIPSPDVVDHSAGPATSNVPWTPSPDVVDPPAVPTTTNMPSMDWEPSPAVADPTNVLSIPSPDVVDHSAGPATSNAPSMSWNPSPNVVGPPAVPTTTNAPSMDWEPSPAVVDPAAAPATSNVPSMSWNPSPNFVDPPAVPTTTNAPSMDWEPSPAVVDPAAAPATNEPSTSWTPSPDVVDPSAVPTTTNAPSMDWEPSPAVVDPAAAPATNEPSKSWTPIVDPVSTPATSNAPSMSWTPSPHIVDSSAIPAHPSPYVESTAPSDSNPMEGVTTDGPSPVVDHGTTTTTTPTASGTSSSKSPPPSSPARSWTPMEDVMNAAGSPPPVPDAPMQNHSDQGTSHPATDRRPTDSYSPRVDLGPMDWDAEEFDLGGHSDASESSEQGFSRRSHPIPMIIAVRKITAAREITAVREVTAPVAHGSRLRLDRKMIPMLMCLLTSNQHRIGPGVHVVRETPALVSQDPHEHTDRETAMKATPGLVVHHHREEASGRNMIVLIVLDPPNNQTRLQELIGAIRHDPVAAGALRLHQTTVVILITETGGGVDEHSTLLTLLPIDRSDPAHVNAFQQYPRGPWQPTLEDFRPDLLVSLRSPWNKRLAHLFTNRFIELDEYECKDRKSIQYTFLRHLPQLRTLYRRSIAPKTQAYDHQYTLFKSHKAQNFRRRSLRHRRTRTCKNLARSDESMKRCLSLWERMPLEAVSGDETDHAGELEGFAIKSIPWRSSSPAVIKWFRTFDALHMSTRFTLNDRAGPGRFPRVRFEAHNRVEEHAKPVPGLPRNFYNPDFLFSLDKYDREALDIQPDFDLSFSARVN
ncbi:hypothetical protein CCMSSC00406_0010037 [Pleurotus cornucopiae]|uniref:Uncharacterized protein n=1 Tax=Pleurotus cornucopiae TaxID=5321 RepID=A0ACB7ILR8_PLECO|nr:hypothetical protein CCMSSC00406_0010037 [Pleurotus cornucopiae]